MPFIVIIPARYESTRLPGKPLKDIAGTSMIQRVWQQAIKSGASRVIIATDDERIKQAASDFGAEVCMTRDDHVSGTDRLQEVANILALKGDQLVVNVQGDEPLIPPAVIDQVANNLASNPSAGVRHSQSQLLTLWRLGTPVSLKWSLTVKGWPITLVVRQSPGRETVLRMIVIVRHPQSLLDGILASMPIGSVS